MGRHLPRAALTVRHRATLRPPARDGGSDALNNDMCGPIQRCNWRTAKAVSSGAGTPTRSEITSTAACRLRRHRRRIPLRQRLVEVAAAQRTYL